MAPVGKNVESAFISTIRDFFLVTQDPVLDRLKVDSVIIGAKLVSPPLFFPPLAVQITTRLGDWEKRGRFFETMKNLNVAKTVFVEIDADKLTTALALNVAAAMLFIVLGKDSPRHSLVRVSGSSFDCHNLEELMGSYRNWLKTVIQGQLRGRLVFWRWLENEERPDPIEETRSAADAPSGSEKDRAGYGFIELLRSAGPGTSTEGDRNFYVSSQNIPLEILEKLRKKDGNISAEQIELWFFDGGVREGKYLRKTAIEIRPFEVK